MAAELLNALFCQFNLSISISKIHDPQVNFQIQNTEKFL